MYCDDKFLLDVCAHAHNISNNHRLVMCTCVAIYMQSTMAPYCIDVENMKHVYQNSFVASKGRYMYLLLL